MPIKPMQRNTILNTNLLKDLIRKQLVKAMTPSSSINSSSSSVVDQSNLLKTTLYSFPPSTCSWRVRAALYHHLPLISKFISCSCCCHSNQQELPNNDEKRVSDYERYIKNQIVNVDLFSKMNEKEDYEQVNPMKQVPALELKNNNLRILLTQSLPTIEFIDNMAELIIQEESSIFGQTLHPDYHYLIPKNDLYLKYKTNQLSEIVNSGIQPYQNIRLLRKIPKEIRGEDNKMWISEWQRKGMNQIEDIISEDYKDHSIEELTQLSTQQPLYFIRDYNKLSMADLFLVPSIEAGINRSDINMEKEFPYSFAIYNSLKDLQIFTQTRN